MELFSIPITKHVDWINDWRDYSCSFAWAKTLIRNGSETLFSPDTLSNFLTPSKRQRTKQKMLERGLCVADFLAGTWPRDSDA